MQGGASEGGIGLTAYVVVALLENGVSSATPSGAVSDG